MLSEYAIRVDGLSKCYQIYDSPGDRLKQFLLPRVDGVLDRPKRKYFREFWALHGASFEVRKGESVGILGRNGSGKSTLLQLITGTLTPTSGCIEVQGRVGALLELGAGFNPEFTGRENVYLGGALQGFTTAQIDERFDGIAGFADIGSFMDMPVKTYSSGMYARLAFAAAIHNVPEVLIVDEILAVGDSAFQSKCIKKLYRMLDDGVSVLLVSHDAYQVRSVCQKALLLERGVQKFFGSSERAMSEYISAFERDQEPEPAIEAGVKDQNAPAVELVGNHGFAVSISDVKMLAGDGYETDAISSGDAVTMEFSYRIHGEYDGDLSFVVNLYRYDDVYVFGTTTAMRGLSPYPAVKIGVVRVDFPSLPLVSGRYKWRVAVNDGGGLHILTEAVPVCPFQVADEFRAVGLVDIEHAWSVGGKN